MSDEGDAIANILSGSSVIFVGQVLHKAIAFFASVFMARVLGDTGYGIVALVLVFYFLGTQLLGLGLNVGIARNYPMVETPEERRSILVSSFQLSLPVAVGAAVLLALAADPIASWVFSEPELSGVLRIIAIAIPLNVTAKLSQGAIRGIKRPGMRVAIQSILNPIVRLVAIVAFVLAGFDTVGVAAAYVLSAGIVAVLSLIVVVQNTELLDFDIPSRPQYRSLLRFSLPLLASGIIIKVMKNVDTVLLGVFRPAGAVGQYNVAYTLSETTLLLYLSLGFMYVPVLSELYGDGRVSRAGEIYQTLTKWIFVLSLPFIGVALLYPEYVITFIYSAQYSESSLPFVILVAGFLTHLAVGQNQNTLTAFGDTKTLMVVDSGTLVVNLVLNFTLIPRFGAVGAAIATASAYVIRNVGLTAYLYTAYGFRPFDRTLVRSVLPVFAGILILRLLPLTPSAPVAVGTALLLLVVTGLSYVKFGVESDDVLLAERIESEFGVNLTHFRELHERLR